MGDKKKLQVTITGNSKSLQSASKQANKSLGTVGKAATQLGGALAGAFGAGVIISGISSAVKKIAEFESTMRRVAIISKGSEAELTKLAKTLGKTTVFTANAAGNAMTFLAQAGFKANQILEATPGVLELAAAAQLDLGRAADIASNVLSAYGLEASEINRINDILVTTTNNANTNVEQFAEAFKVVGPIAKAAGVSINEVSSLIGVLGDAGIQGSLAGTQLKTAISTLISPSDKAAAVLKKLDVSTKNADGSMRNLTDIFADLRDANITAEQAFDIFEQRAASGAIVMAGAAEKAAFLAEQTREIGVSSAQAREQLDTLSGDIKLLDSAWEGAIMNGSAFNDVMRFMTQGVTLLVSTFSELANAGFNIVTFYDNLKQKSAALKLETSGAASTYNDFKDALFGVADAAAVTDPLLKNILGIVTPLVEKTKELTEEQLAYNQFIQEAISSNTMFAESFKMILGEEGQGLIGYNSELSKSNILLTSHIKLQEINAAKAKKISDAIEAQETAQKNNNAATLQGVAAATTMAIANGESAKSIIKAALAATIAQAIFKAFASGGLGFFTSLALAAAAPLVITGLFNALPAFARGTSFAPGGMALVGERGPELVNLPAGSRVTPNHLSGGGGGVSIVVNGFVGNEFELAQQIETVLRNQSSNVARATF